MNKEIILKPRILKILVAIMLALVIFALAFSAGVFIGERKARFSCASGDAYHRNFGARNNFLPGARFDVGEKIPEINDREFMNPNGVFGKIIKIVKSSDINLPSAIIISSPNGLEQNVLISSTTNIKLMRDDISIDQLKNNDLIAVIGDDNSGQISAKLIRVMPAPQGFNLK
ncbi:MAG: hypothetical protein WCK37_01650 [Candidatus Falkowbacteria bacterium]